MKTTGASSATDTYAAANGPAAATTTGNAAARHTATPNVIDVCGTDNSTGCHGWVHRHPEQARALGYLLKSYDPEPSTVPVYSVRRGWILLDTDGQWHSCPPPEGMPNHPQTNR